MSGHAASNAVVTVLLSLMLVFRFLDVRLRFGITAWDRTLWRTYNGPSACLKAPDAEIT